MEEFTLSVPTIYESKIEMDYREKQIDVSGGPNRMFFDHSGPFYVAGTEFTCILPFAGDAAFFDVQPQNFTYSSSGSRAVVRNNEIQFSYAGANLNPDAAKREFQNEVQLIRQNLQNLKSAVDVTGNFCTRAKVRETGARGVGDTLLVSPKRAESRLVPYEIVSAK